MPQSPVSPNGPRWQLVLGFLCFLIALGACFYFWKFGEVLKSTGEEAEVSQPKIEPLTSRDGRLYDSAGNEVALFGVNFQTPVSWEYKFQYRAAGIPLEGAALNKLTDDHLQDLVALRATIVRAHLAPADFADAEGNLRPSPYLDALEHLLARCAEKGLRVYLTLINEQGPGHFPDSFMEGVKRDQWLVDEAFLAKSEVFIAALLNHKNPKTGRFLKDEPALSLLEPVNEPAYPKITESRKQAVANAVERLYQAIRSTGAKQPVIWNLNWPGMMWNHKDVFEAVAESRVEGVSFCLYPGQNDIPQTNFWDYPQDLSKNNYLPYLKKVLSHECELAWTLSERFRSKFKVVYEFETFFNQSAYMYPAMAALFRQMGVQVACMWHYRMLPPALLQGGSHYLNLYTTPRKALAFEAGSMVFQNTPLLTPGHFDSPTRMSGTHWFADAEKDLAVYDDGVTWISTNRVQEASGPHDGIKSISGWQQTPWISYEGTGAFHARAVDKGWELTLRPDVEFFRQAWEKPKQKGEPLCRLLTNVPHRLKLNLPGIPQNGIVLSDGTKEIAPAEAAAAVFDVVPGNYHVLRPTGFFSR